MALKSEDGGSVVLLTPFFLAWWAWCLFGEYPGYSLHLIDITLLETFLPSILHGSNVHLTFYTSYSGVTRHYATPYSGKAGVTR